MNIQIWSDFACPFCYIGQHNLHVALKRLVAEGHSINIIHRSYELSPEAAINSDKTAYAELAEKYAVSLDRARAMTINASQIGKEAGLMLDFDKVRPTNTFNAHQLIHFIKAQVPKLIEAGMTAVFKGYFEEGMNIGDEKAVIAIGTALGLDEAALATALRTQTYAAAVREEEARAHALEINSVPFFVINDAVALSGAQTPENFYQVIMEIIKEETVITAAGGHCGDGQCNI